MLHGRAGELGMARVTVVNVTLEDRPDGGLRVSSENLPGLILSGPDRAAVVDCIIPAIEELFARRGRDVMQVRPAEPIEDVLEAPSPRDVEVHVRYRQFVVELERAAA